MSAVLDMKKFLEKKAAQLVKICLTFFRLLKIVQLPSKGRCYKITQSGFDFCNLCTILP